MVVLYKTNEKGVIETGLFDGFSYLHLLDDGWRYTKDEPEVETQANIESPPEVDVVPEPPKVVKLSLKERLAKTG